MDEEIPLDDEVNNFSEEEEAMFVAEETTESESDRSDRRRRSPAPALGNVTAFRRPREDRGPAAAPLAPRPPSHGWGPHQFIPQDHRVLLLFDLNGVLVHHTFNGHSHKHFLRPGAGDLLRLLPSYRLGVYSSATQRTVQRAIAKLHEDLAAALPPGARPPPGGFFEVVLCRDHCVLAKEIGASRPGGKPWDTVKPLGRYFRDLSRIMLVDDSPHKSLPEEAGNMLVMPVWEGPDSPGGRADGALPALVEGLLAASGGGDARAAAAAVSARLLALAPPPPLPAAAGSPSPPPHARHGAGAAAPAAAAAAITAAYPALQELLTARLGGIPPPLGATLYDINTLLQRRFMAAFSPLFGGSAREAVGRLVAAGAVVEHHRAQGSAHGTRYALPEGAAAPGPQELVDIQARLAAAAAAAAAEEDAGGAAPAQPACGADSADWRVRPADAAQRPPPSKSRRRKGKPGGGVPAGGKTIEDPEAERALVAAVMVELATRPGVPRDHLDACLVDELRGAGALAGWFGPLAARDPARRAAEALRMAISRALDACCAAELAELVGTAVGGTPPPLFHVRLTEAGAAAVEAAGEVVMGPDVTAAAAEEIAAELRARRIPSATAAPSPPPPPPPRAAGEFAGGLPVFEDRGVPAAGAAPPAVAPQAAAPAAGAPAEDASAAAADPPPPGQDPPPPDQPLTKKQRKLANMRARLGLPPGSGHSMAELRALTQELRRAESGAAAASVARARTMAAAGAAETPLHRELAALARAAAPTPQEIAAVEAAVRAVDAAARSVWPSARAVLFGSQATGLALPGGDLDVVVLGVGPEMPSAALGFTPSQRRAVAGLLEDLVDALRRGGAALTAVHLIADAKVPIVKCLLQAGGDRGPALAVDVSFGAGNGAAAVAFLRRQLAAVPPLRPLALAVKALLRDRGLNEVFTGGIGSYAVVNMVLAHLQAEGFKADLAEEQRRDRALRSRQPRAPPALGDDPMGDTFRFLERLAAEAEAEPGADGSADGGSGAGGGPVDLGTLLWGFLERFGCEFDFERRAVSIRRGGFVRKGRWKQARRPWLIAVEDPQDPGRDICAGSFNIQTVRDEFAAAAATLAELCEDAEANEAAAAAAGSPGGGGGGSGGRDAGLPMLSMLLDVECAVGRGPAAQAARRALEHRAEAEREAVKSRKRAAPWAAAGDPLSLPPARKRRRGEDGGPAVAPTPKKQKKAALAPPRGRARGQPRGSKAARAVEVQWKDRRGQFMDPYEDGPAYYRDEEREQRQQRGGGGGGGRRRGRDGAQGPPGVKPPHIKRKAKAKAKKKATKAASAKKGDKGK